MRGLSDIGTIKDILHRHGFTFSKALGQNFLINPSVCPRMAELSGAGEGVGVIEIGPGIGVLTNELCQLADKVVAVELDKRLIPVLGETLAEYDNVKVINADVLELDLNKLIEDEFSGMEVVICANLPYYITTQILLTLLEKNLPVTKIVTMVQREVAERMTAAPGSKIYGALSVAVQFRSQAQIAFEVPPESFLPSPEVTSAVVVCDVRKPPFEVDEDFFVKIVRAAFAQRRKTLLNSLTAAGFPREKILASGIDTSRRAETLSLSEFASLSNALK